MTHKVDARLAKYLLDNWEDSRRAQEVQDMIEAMVVELKSDYRDYQRRHRVTDEDAAHWEGLISDVTTKDFWNKLEHILEFTFPF